MTDKTKTPGIAPEALDAIDLAAVCAGSKKHLATISHEPLTLELGAPGDRTPRFIDHDLDLND